MCFLYHCPLYCRLATSCSTSMESQHRALPMPRSCSGFVLEAPGCAVGPGGLLTRLKVWKDPRNRVLPFPGTGSGICEGKGGHSRGWETEWKGFDGLSGKELRFGLCAISKVEAGRKDPFSGWEFQKESF